jgi:hypothetical protein
MASCKLLLAAWSRTVPNDFTRTRTQQTRQIQPPLPACDIRDAGNPHLIRFMDGKLLVQDIRSHGVCLQARWRIPGEAAVDLCPSHVTGRTSAASGCGRGIVMPTFGIQPIGRSILHTNLAWFYFLRVLYRVLVIGVRFSRSASGICLYYKFTVDPPYCTIDSPFVKL